MRKSCLMFLTVVVFFVIPNLCFAVNRSWNDGVTDNLWSNPTNWTTALSVTEITYTNEDEQAPAFVIENAFYRATLVPDMGGRILSWVDKNTGTALVYDNGYGGLLDDHGPRPKMPYVVEWLKRAEDEVVVSLTLEDDVKYCKTLSFYAGCSVIVVDYHVENHGQVPNRMLFRNIVRPGGTEFTGDELYCYSRVTGLQRVKGMPRTDDQADPWCALVHVPSKLTVANAFDGDILQRLYTWRGSKISPTYEFMFPQLKAGYQVNIRYTWAFAHGLSAIDYAHRTFLAQVEGAVTDGKLNAQLDVVGTWGPMPDLKVSVEVLNSDRSRIGAVAAVAMPVAAIDTVASMELSVPVPNPGDYVILLLTLESSLIGSAPVIIEKPFIVGNDPKRLAAYRRPVRWLGEPVLQEPIPGWQKQVTYTIQPNEADRARGYMVFDEIGAEAGLHTTALHFSMVQNEPEAFPLRLYSITKTGALRIDVEAPAGITLESFIPELVPEKIWGQTLYGLKLNPGVACEIVPGDDRLLYFRIRTGAVVPGEHVARLTFNLPDAEPISVDLHITVYPIRFPRHPFMVFDVNNAVNYLCSRKVEKSGNNRVWDEERAKNYLGDMAAHGVRGQTLNGVNAPNSYYWYNRVKVRETGEVLTEAIKKNPARFRDRLNLPALDFREWDWLVDHMLAYGQTCLRWPMGGCGDSFLQGHSRLTSQIYGRTFPSGDMRQQVVQEWYYREVTQYLKDRGLTRIFGIIDDEIPSEKLAWWVQHAYRCLQMGVEPGVTQSAETIASSLRVNLVAPFMKYWVIGTLHKASIDLRRKQNLIKPEHRVLTYHSSANHWQPYSNTRGHCGLNSAYFDLDACWIQTYYRWRQSEAIIYHGDKGPTSSAAWEGARDGLDDGNMLRLARAMVAALPDSEQRDALTIRVEAIVGMREDSLVRFKDRMSGVGMVTAMVRYDTVFFREAKRRLLDLVVELSSVVPVQKAGVNFGLHALIRNGVALYRVPAGMLLADKAAGFLVSAAGALEFRRPLPVKVDALNPYPVFFVGSLQELRTLLPTLANHPDLSDLDDLYPRAGEYVLRFVRRKPDLKKKESEEQMLESMLVIAPDEAGVEKALTVMLNVVTPPRSLYSHWLITYRSSGAGERL